MQSDFEPFVSDRITINLAHSHVEDITSVLPGTKASIKPSVLRELRSSITSIIDSISTTTTTTSTTNTKQSKMAGGYYGGGYKSNPAIE